MPDPLTFHRVLALPDPVVSTAVYFVQSAPGIMDIVVTGTDGTPHTISMPRDALHMTFGSTGKPAANAEFGRYLVVETLDLEALASAAISSAPATAQSDVLVTRGPDLVARFRWEPASSTAAVTVLVPTIGPGDLLLFIAPIAQDATLAGITGTLAGLRRIA